MKRGRQFPETEYYQQDFPTSELEEGGRSTTIGGLSTFAGLEGNNEGAKALVGGAEYDYLPPTPDENGQYKLFDYRPPRLTGLAKTEGASPVTLANVLAMVKTQHPDIEPPNPKDVNPMSAKTIKTAADRGFVTIPERYGDYFGKAKETWDSLVEAGTRGRLGIRKSTEKADKDRLKLAQKWGDDLVKSSYIARDTYRTLDELRDALGNKPEKGEHRRIPTEQVTQSRQRIIGAAASKEAELPNAQEQAFAEYDAHKAATQGDTNLFGEPLNPRERM
jgi:hypothetical protein